MDFEQVNLLLLEDCDLNRDSYSALLRHMLPSVTVHTAATYSDATALLAQHPIDLAVLDFHLGIESQYTGLDVVRFIHTQHMRTRSILLTNFDSVDLVREYKKVGAFGCVPKRIPGGGKVLLEALETVWLKNLNYFPNSVGHQDRRQRPRHITLASMGVSDRIAEVLYFLKKRLYQCTNWEGVKFS